MSIETPEGFVRYEVICEADRPAALLLAIDGSKSHWVPRSLLHDDSDILEAGDSGTVYLPLWFCDKEGLPT